MSCIQSEHINGLWAKLLLLFLIFMSNFIGTDFYFFLLVLVVLRFTRMRDCQFSGAFFPSSQPMCAFFPIFSKSTIFFFWPSFGCLFLLCHIHDFFSSVVRVCVKIHLLLKNNNETVWSHRRSLATFCRIHDRIILYSWASNLFVWNARFSSKWMDKSTCFAFFHSSFLMLRHMESLVKLPRRLFDNHMKTLYEDSIDSNLKNLSVDTPTAFHVNI